MSPCPQVEHPVRLAVRLARIAVWVGWPGDGVSHDAGESPGGAETGAGVLEMWCIERDGGREWKLEFDVRYNPT